MRKSFVGREGNGLVSPFPDRVRETLTFGL